jgi:arabinose-5-phosphate isomerase
LLKVGDIMQQGDALPLISASAKMDQALLLLSAKNMGCVLIVEEGSNILLGIITDGDLKRHMNPNLLSMRVDEIMTHDPKSIAKDALAVEALEHMTTRYKQSLTCLPVTQDGVLCGLIRVQDCLMAGVA